MEESLINKISEFIEDRNWSQFHNPKDLAISISIESAELLENFQWSTSEESVTNHFNNIQDELADVLIYSILLSKSLNLDIENIILEKLKKNEVKYPVSKAFGKKDKYTEL